MSFIFDQMFRDLLINNTSREAFPFYNVVRTGEATFEVHLALAGYKMQDIQLTVEGDNLIVKSDGINDRDVDYIRKGFTTRPFLRKFIVSQDVIINGAELEDGVLRICMERQIPEKLKVKQIQINKPKTMILNEG
jgi:molecular chaperone IbpA